MPKFDAVNICSAGWKIYLEFCKLADTRGEKKNAANSWKKYKYHRNHCKKCTPIGKYQDAVLSVEAVR
jgi:hypothetical protein